MPVKTTIGLVLLLGLTGAATATPFAVRLDIAPEAAPTLIHHKPGHKGGPPWARGNREGQRYAAPRQECRTEVRERVDGYTGDVVRRTVQVCR